MFLTSLSNIGLSDFWILIIIANLSWGLLIRLDAPDVRYFKKSSHSHVGQSRELMQNCVADSGLYVSNTCVFHFLLEPLDL